MAATDGGRLSLSMKTKVKKNYGNLDKQFARFVAFSAFSVSIQAIGKQKTVRNNNSNRKNPSVTGGHKEETLGLSLQERPFLFTAVTYTVTRGLAGTDEQVGVPKGRTENEQTDYSKKEREKTEGQRARGSGGTTM
ncbi:hypothetical protein M9H77_24194 [Catharanthus roseus]|uniref:Uncharacterized protein n=1 Tax=Catharanthus roseus TaxID=4058 RepID=A0ACC0AVT4_CATRO|nr:hypothetical protein M9H77_24194 [Catharanthus roseus]